MTIPTVCTFDLESPSVPRRAGLTDLLEGGTSKSNDAEYPPDEETMPTADEYNQHAFQLAALNRISPLLAINVYYVNGTPTVRRFSSVTANLAIEDFQVTDTGTGDATITWPANVLPEPILPPVASIVGTTPLVICASQPTVRSVRVVTKSDAGSATDAEYIVLVF